MICIVLAAGYATRMYPLTENFPKPLLKVQGKPILDWLLEDVDRIPDIDQIIVISNHKFVSHFRTWQSKSSYATPIAVLDDGSESSEERIGAVKDIHVALNTAYNPTDALVIAGDNVLEFSFGGFVDYYNAIRRSCVMCYEEPNIAKQRKTGIIMIDEDCCITSFEEKPASPQSSLAVPPFYCYTAGDLSRIDEAIADGCGTDAPGSLAAWLSRNSAVYAWKMPGKRYDIGSLEGYREVQTLFQPQNCKT